MCCVVCDAISSAMLDLERGVGRGFPALIPWLDWGCCEVWSLTLPLSLPTVGWVL
jgi:hypothetical protein